MTKVDNGAFFIRLKNTNDIRKTILECSKDAIIVLQRFERFRDIRKQKLEAIKKLSALASDIDRISAELKENLPELDYEKEGIEIAPDEPEHPLDNIQESIENMDKDEDEKESSSDEPEISEDQGKQDADPERSDDGLDDDQNRPEDADDGMSPEDEDLSELKKLEDSISQIEEKIKSMG